MDWAFATLSMSALASPSDAESNQTAATLRSKITNPTVQGFSTAVFLLVGGSSASEVIREVSKLDPRNRLFFLRQWALANEHKADTADVLDHSIDLLIKDTQYTPKTRDLREIATPLPHITDQTKMKSLVGRFDSQKGSIEDLGTTVDYVRLQLILAHAESKYDFSAACNRVMEVYWYIAQVQDLEIKVECTAWLAAFLSDIDRNNDLENKEGLQTVVEQELRASVTELLSGTADHLDVFRDVIRALAKAKPHLALEFAQSLNTSDRRDAAILELVKGLVDPKELDPIFIQQTLSKVVDSEMKDTAIVNVMERLAAPGPTVNVKSFLSLIDDLKQVIGAHSRCRAYCFAYTFLTVQGSEDHAELKIDLLKRLSDAWQSIDAGWKKVDVGFRIARTLADISPDIAGRYLQDVTHVRDGIVGDSEGPALTYLACLRLAVRAYGGLLPRNASSPSHFEWLTKLIDRIPSNGDRAELWAEVALRCFINDHVTDAQRIVTDYVKPLIQNISTGDTNYRSEIIVRTAAALYIGHHTTALELISKLDASFRDYAYFHICLFLMSKVPTGEPYEYTSGDGYSLTSDDAVDVCTLMAFIDEDALLYRLICKLADSVLSRRNREKWSRQQKDDIAARLDGLVASKLPDKRNITHDGFVIAARAAIARIRQVLSSQADQLVFAAQAIPNIADRSYVLSVIASGMTSKESSKRTTILNDARQYAEKIPSALDRVRRFLGLAQTTLEIDAAYAKNCLQTAMASSVGTNDSEAMYGTQRQIIDLAHKIDPNYAASLASLLDNDPARRKAKDDLKQRLATLDLRKEMGMRKLSDMQARVKPADYPKAAWMNLAALNAGRLVETIHSEYVTPFIFAASNLRFQESYPIFAWVIENAVRRYARTEHAASGLVPLFEAALFGAELTGRIAVRSSIKSRHLMRFIDKDINTGKETLIHAGERDKAIQFLKDWFSKEGGDYLKICDPYFGKSDLELLHILQGVNPQCRFSVLTSRKHQLHDGLQQPWDESYRNYWRIRISNQEPPDTEIVVAGVESSGDLPIHDRWWVTAGGGLCVGTSFNALGLNKAASIRVLGIDEARMFENEIDQYLSRTKREHNRQKLLYGLFSL